VNRRIMAVCAVTVVLFAAACSGGDGPEFSYEVIPRSEPTVQTTVETDTSAEESDETPTPTAEPVGPLSPLTGLPVDGAGPSPDRPPLMVKIDNSPDARPQEGLNTADIGVELLVEGITRLALVFHSDGAETVGPVRSGRSSDPDLAGVFGTPLFAWSGGNNTVRREVRNGELAGKLYDVGVDQSPSSYWRAGPPRLAPHNLMTSTENLYALGPENLGPPPVIFDYRAEGDNLPAAAEAIPGVQISWRGGVNVHYVWNEDVGGWSRFQRGTPHRDAAGVVVSPPNVYLLTTPYGTSAASPLSPQALSVGSGAAVALTMGSQITGTWSRDTANLPWDIVDAAGDDIGLTPGRTWVAMHETHDVRILTQDEADNLLALVQ